MYLLTRFKIYLDLDFYHRAHSFDKFIRKNVGTVSLHAIIDILGKLNSETQAYRCYRSPQDGVLVFVRRVSGTSTCTGQWSLNPCASFDSVETQLITHLFFVEAPSDDWSDTEDEEVENADPSRRTKILEKRLALAQQSLVDYRTLITEKCNIPNLIKDINEFISRQVASTSRDDDTHYFQS